MAAVIADEFYFLAKKRFWFSSVLSESSSFLWLKQKLEFLLHKHEVTDIFQQEFDRNIQNISSRSQNKQLLWWTFVLFHSKLQFLSVWCCNCKASSRSSQHGNCSERNIRVSAADTSEIVSKASLFELINAAAKKTKQTSVLSLFGFPAGLDSRLPSSRISSWQVWSDTAAILIRLCLVRSNRKWSSHKRPAGLGRDHPQEEVEIKACSHDFPHWKGSRRLVCHLWHLGS